MQWRAGYGRPSSAPGIAPIAAVEQTATGYDVAWKVTGGTADWGADQYTRSGPPTAAATTPRIRHSVWFREANPALESIETAFHQDLNGDGTIGLISPSIKGSNTLTLVGNQYYLNNGSSSVALTYAGAPVVVGQFGAGIAPISAVKTASGYDVAWKVTGTGADQYTVWSTDSSGHYLSNIFGLVSGTDSRDCKTLETTFFQDLNGDGVIDTASTAPPSS